MFIEKQIFDNFEDRLNYFMHHDLLSSFENLCKLFKLFFINSYMFGFIRAFIFIVMPSWKSYSKYYWPRKAKGFGFITHRKKIWIKFRYNYWPICCIINNSRKTIATKIILASNLCLLILLLLLFDQHTIFLCLKKLFSIKFLWTFYIIYYK